VIFAFFAAFSGTADFTGFLSEDFSLVCDALTGDTSGVGAGVGAGVTTGAAVAGSGTGVGLGGAGTSAETGLGATTLVATGAFFLMAEANLFILSFFVFFYVVSVFVYECTNGIRYFLFLSMVFPK
jgi:hypothetical protein